MSRRIQLILLLASAIGFTILVRQIGLARLVDDAQTTGWLFVPIIASYALVHLCHAATWHLILADVPERPPFLRTLAISISGFGFNTLTPVVPVGGEAFRIACLSPWVGTRRATSATISFFLIHTIGSLAIWITALFGALILLRHQPFVVALGVPLLLLLCLASWGLLSSHRAGILERLLAILRRLPLPRRTITALEAHREAVLMVDREIVKFYRTPGRFIAAVAFDYLGRCIGFAEYWLACMSLGIPLGYGGAFVVGGLAAMGSNLLFFVPFELGWKEGLLYAIFGAFGLDPATGIYVSVVTRVREVCWIAIGIALMWTGSQRPVVDNQSLVPMR